MQSKVGERWHKEGIQRRTKRIRGGGTTGDDKGGSSSNGGAMEGERGGRDVTTSDNKEDLEERDLEG